MRVAVSKVGGSDLSLQCGAQVASVPGAIASTIRSYESREAEVPARPSETPLFGQTSLSEQSSQVLFQFRERLSKSRGKQISRLGGRGLAALKPKVLQIRHIDRVHNIRGAPPEYLVDS